MIFHNHRRSAELVAGCPDPNDPEDSIAVVVHLDEKAGRWSAYPREVWLPLIRGMMRMRSANGRELTH